MLTLKSNKQKDSVNPSSKLWMNIKLDNLHEIDSHEPKASKPWKNLRNELRQAKFHTAIKVSFGIFMDSNETRTFFQMNINHSPRKKAQSRKFFSSSFRCVGVENKNCNNSAKLFIGSFASHNKILLFCYLKVFINAFEMRRKAWWKSGEEKLFTRLTFSRFPPNKSKINHSSPSRKGRNQ